MWHASRNPEVAMKIARRTQGAYSFFLVATCCLRVLFPSDPPKKYFSQTRWCSGLRCMVLEVWVQGALLQELRVMLQQVVQLVGSCRQIGVSCCSGSVEAQPIDRKQVGGPMRLNLSRATKTGLLGASIPSYPYLPG